MASEVIDVQPTDRVAIFGQTGSGKTYFARYLLRSARRLVVVDPKGMLRGKWGLQEWGARTRKELVRGRPVRVRIPSPIPNGNEDPSVQWNTIFRFLYECGNLILYVDEMYGVVPIGKRAPNYLNAIYTRGRELGMGVVAVSQRPAWIPREMISESSWFFCFRLMLEDDRKSVAQIMGPIAENYIRDTYGFLTFNAEWQEPIYTPQLEVRNQKGA